MRYQHPDAHPLSSSPPEPIANDAGGDDVRRGRSWTPSVPGTQSQSSHKVLVEDGLSRVGGVLDYGIVVVGLHSRSVAYASSVKRRVRDNEEELLRLLLGTKDPDLVAIRKEVDC